MFQKLRKRKSNINEMRLKVLHLWKYPKKNFFTESATFPEK